MVPEVYPPQQPKTEAVINALKVLMHSKSKQEMIATGLPGKLAAAIAKSNHIMAEDIIREAGYMLPQSDNTLDFLKSLIDHQQLEGFPKEAVEKLLEAFSKNMKDKNMSENKTLNNLMEAFTGEAQANRKYLAYAKKAEKDGKLNAAKLFKAASDAETLHALKHFEVAAKVGTTADNLLDAVAGETHEYKEMYPDFVKEAEAEGNKAALMSFTFAMKAEEVHAKLYKEALENLDQTEEVFYYLCPVCGNIEKVRPNKCSICGVPGDKFIKY
jgi:rubrerythrin